MQNWLYNEKKHCGVDYADKKQAKKYDEQHLRFRDYEKEFRQMIEFLNLKNTRELTVIDLGCGTGASTIYAMKRFKKVYAVDISETMINQARKKISSKKALNVEFINAGFVSYKHKGKPVDLLITKAAFHHLPDFWKQIALLNMNKMINMGGILYIDDIVFNFNPIDYNQKINEWIIGFEKQVSKEFKEEIEVHIREEYSTFKWILDGMIEKAGFKIEDFRTKDDFICEYHCRKVTEKK